MSLSITIAVLLAFPLIVSGIPSENLGTSDKQRGPPVRTCSSTCFPGKGKAAKECGTGRNTNPDCFLQVCQLSNLGGQIKAGYKCTPFFIEPSFPPFPRFTPEPRETFAPVPEVECPAVCRESEFTADEDCTSGGFAIAGCRVDSVCSTSTGSGFQCAAYDGITDTQTFIPSISGLELIVQYQWSAGQFDLDSATEFLGDKVGSTCDFFSGTFIEFQGDDTSEGGTESYIVRISDALDASAWSGSTTVNLFAGWYSEPQEGPITISASLRDSATGFPIANSEISISATTDAQTSCSTFLLGQVVITELADSVSLEIIPQ